MQFDQILDPKGPSTIIVGIRAPKVYAIPLLGPFGGAAIPSRCDDPRQFPFLVIRHCDSAGLRSLRKGLKLVLGETKSLKLKPLTPKPLATLNPGLFV